MEEMRIRNGILEAYTGRENLVEVPEGVHTIGEEAFKACVSIRRAVLPSSLCRILAGAFKGCRNLEEIEIPKGVSFVGAYAFHRCHSLKKIALPPSVTELGDCVFLYCDSLEEARIPGVRRLGVQVFVNDVQLRRLEISEALWEDCICDVFTGCGSLCEISIIGSREPEKTPGAKAEPGEDCPGGGTCHRFENAVEAVVGDRTFPSLVRTIAWDILRMMELEGRCMVTFRTNLKHVDIPEGIERIGKSCFFDKRGILSVKLPKSLKEIGSRAFRNCINLEEVIFKGENVSVHEDAFKNCSSLKKIRMPDGSAYELEGIGALQKELPDQARVIWKQVLGNFRISGSMLLKYLGEEPRVAVPEGITRIAEEAFAGNEAIDRVLLPESLEEIGAGAFRGCVLLQTITFPERLRRIGAGAFENCVKLLRVKLPEGMEELEEKAFKRCRALKEVCFGERFRSIGEQAFYGCSALKEVSFPESIVSLGEMAFYRCGGLGAVRLPAKAEQVGSLAFAESGVRQVCISGSGREYGTGIFSDCVHLKTMILEEGVCHIADRTAYGCTALRQVFLPDSIRSAGRNVWEKTPFLETWLKGGQEQGAEILWDGRNLEGEARLPGTVRIIAGGAFYGNKGLTGIWIPESVEWIGAAAFKGCSGLRQVSWPGGGCRWLEPEVFSGCTQLERITIDREKKEDTAGNVNWQTIGECAFYHCKSLREICMAEATEIGKEAFAGCVQMSFPLWDVRKIQWIGERAFEDTPLLPGVKGVPAVVGTIVVSGKGCSGEICLEEGITGIAPFAFSGNREITRLVLPESLERIGEGAFWGCSSLGEVRFPENPCIIDARAFEKCSSLLEVKLRAAKLRTAAFAYCISLKRAEIIGKTILPERLFEGCVQLEACVCKAAGAVKAQCFSGCAKLEQFDFSRIHVVKEYAFAGCDSLRRVEFPDGACVGAHAFEDCGCLEEIVLLGERGDIRLREYAFSGCTALGRVSVRGKEWKWNRYGDILQDSIPETVRLLFHSALSCFEVEREEVLRGYRGAGRRIRIPEGIRRIEAEVFRDMPGLGEIAIPDSVEYIGARAFHGTAWMEKQRKASPVVTVNQMLLDGSQCTGEVTVPEGIRLVCGWAFANGMGIERIRFLSERVRVDEFAFRNCIYLREIILPDGSSVKLQGIGDRDRELPALAKQAVMDSLNCFKTDGKGVLVECTGNISRLRMAEGITAIGEGAFQDGNLLTEIILPRTVKKIGRRAFAGCKWLRNVRQARAVEEIGDMAFFGCGALEEVELSENLRGFGIRAFENCTSLREIFIPEGVEEIPDRAFYRCHSLKRVCLPSSLRRIGKEAFAFCRGMEEILMPDGVLAEERAFYNVNIDIKES